MIKAEEYGIPTRGEMKEAIAKIEATIDQTKKQELMASRPS